jgi:hypothetical protein
MRLEGERVRVGGDVARGTRMVLSRQVPPISLARSKIV